MTWRSTVALRLAALTIAAGSLSVTAQARAGTLDRALSDTDSTPTAAAAQSALRAQEAVCRVGHPGHVLVPDTSSALAGSIGLLAAHSSTGRVKALLAGGALGRDTDVAVSLSGLAKGQPDGALVGFLAAHQNDPSDPLPLLNAAVTLSAVGRQPDALALLNAAQRLPSAGVATLGIPVGALIDNAHGVGCSGSVALRKQRRCSAPPASGPGAFPSRNATSRRRTCAGVRWPGPSTHTRPVSIPIQS